MPCTFNNSQEGQGGWSGENKEKSSKNGSPKGNRAPDNAGPCRLL